MKLFLCAAAALTLSVSTMNAQDKADVVKANKTQVVKESGRTQSVEMKKEATKEIKSTKAVMREDSKGAKGNYAESKKSQEKKATKTTDAKKADAKASKEKKEKKAKQKVKSIDY